MSTEHPFLRSPNRTLVTLSIPVMLSLIAEPVTGMVDTAFVSQLGAEPLAALGVGTIALTTIYWVFSFLSVSTQTEVAQAMGNQNPQRATEITSLALILSVGFGFALLLVIFPLAEPFSRLLGASDVVQSDAVTYIRFRLFGAPAVLTTFIGFGALRGMQDMKTALWVALGVNITNVVLDAPLVFGLGPIPAMGVAGAALASSISQWIGAIWSLTVVIRRLGFVPRVHLPDILALLHVGGNVFLRTGLLTLYVLLTTRIANQISPEAGAAHQVIRTVWLFFAFLMDGFAVTAQSLVGYFVGARQVKQARRVAALTSQWSLGIGFTLTVVMIIGTEPVIALFLPPEAEAAFRPVWIIGSLIQPIAALAFVTDGIHLDTGDYAFLRNAMLVSTVFGFAALALVDPAAPGAFAHVWTATGLWITLRAIIGMMRVWPGIGHSPLRYVVAS